MLSAPGRIVPLTPSAGIPIYATSRPTDEVGATSSTQKGSALAEPCRPAGGTWLNDEQSRESVETIQFSPATGFATNSDGVLGRNGLVE
jgi:hypothetical protein